MALAALWIVALHAIFWWIHYHPQTKILLADEVQYYHNAIRVYDGGPWHNSLIWPPAYPVFLAGVAKGFGPRLAPVQVLQTVFWLGCGGLLWSLWRRLSGSRLAAGVATFLFLANPSIAGLPLYLWPEVLHLFLMLLALWLPVALAHRPWLAAAGAGAVLGMALLFKSLLTWAWPLWVLLFAWSRPGDLPAVARKTRFAQTVASHPRKTSRPPDRSWWIPRWWRHAGSLLDRTRNCLSEASFARPAEEGSRRRTRLPVLAGRMILFLLVAAAITAPTWLKSWREWGRPVIADSSTFNLWVGLNDTYRTDFTRDATGAILTEYLESSEDPLERREIYRRKILDLVAERGVVETIVRQLDRQYYRLFSAKTVMMSQLPGELCYGYHSRYVEPPTPAVALLALGSHAFHIATLVGFTFGLATWRRWRHPLLWVILGLIAYQLAIFAGLHVKARFVIPMWPFLCGFAGSAVSRFRAGEIISPGRLVAGCLGAALLLWLAFAGPWLDQPCA